MISVKAVRSLLLALLVSVGVAACRGHHDGSEASAAKTANAHARAADKSPPDEAPPPPPKAEPKKLDQMSEPELQAACFAGDVRACDRLGH